jgi:hypothetical protein
MNNRIRLQVAIDFLTTIFFAILILLYTIYCVPYIIPDEQHLYIGSFLASLPYVILYNVFIWFLNAPLPDPNTFEDPELLRYHHRSLPYILVSILIVIVLCIFLLEHTNRTSTLVIAFFVLLKDSFSHFIDAYHFRSDNKKSFASVKNHKQNNDSINEVIPASNVPPTTETAIPSPGEITITIESCHYPIHIIISPKKV